MAWLRKLPMYAVLLLILAGLIAGSGIGYYAYATFSSTVVRGQHSSASLGEAYEWRGQRLFLQTASGKPASSCVIREPNGAQRSVYVPRNSSKGFFNSPDFVEVAPQPGVTATMRCSETVDVTAGDSAIARARTVNSPLFRFGVPALITIPVLLAVVVPTLRRTRQ